MNRANLGRLVLALVLLSAVAASLPPLTGVVRATAALQRVPTLARRERLMGPFYASMLQIVRETAPNEPLALFPLRPENYDGALFFDYYVYPHPTRIYRDAAAYRSDPKAPSTIIEIGEKPMRRTYAEVLAGQARQGAVMNDAALLAGARDAGKHFSVPIVASLHGVPPALYATEALMVADTAAKVTLTIHPAELVADLTIDPGHPARFYDLVAQLFGGVERGWLEVDSTVPLRAAFWFVNRGSHSASEVPIVTKPPSPLLVPAGRQLWLVNLGPTAAALRINGKIDFVDAHAIATRAVDCPCDVAAVSAGASVYGFTAEKQADGGTRFVWPENRP